MVTNSLEEEGRGKKRRGLEEDEQIEGKWVDDLRKRSLWCRLKKEMLHFSLTSSFLSRSLSLHALSPTSFPHSSGFHLNFQNHPWYFWSFFFDDFTLAYSYLATLLFSSLSLFKPIIFSFSVTKNYLVFPCQCVCVSVCVYIHTFTSEWLHVIWEAKAIDPEETMNNIITGLAFFVVVNSMFLTL